MKRLMTAIAFCTLALAVASGNAATIWIGEGADASWKTVENWEGGTPPTGGDVDIYASNLDPEAAYQQATADWDYTGFPGYTYTSIEVVSNDTYAMTLQKSGTKGLNAGTLWLVGYVGYPATLDVDQNMSASSHTYVYKNVVIDVADGMTFTTGAITIGDGTNAATLTMPGDGTVQTD